MDNPSDFDAPDFGATDFDAADLADAILGVDEPLPPPPPPTTTGRTAGMSIAPILIVAFVAAVGLAIILAIGPQRDSDPPPCGGLYEDRAECCIDAGDCEPECEPRDNRRGLFDAEEEFAPGGQPWCDD